MARAQLFFAAMIFVPDSAGVWGFDANGKAPPKGFLSHKEAEAELLVALQEAVGAVHKGEVMSMKDIAVHLQPSFNSLPKNRFGRISGTAVRYLVHSYFMKVHGWLVRGLDPLQARGRAAPEGANQDDHVMVLKDKVPFFINTMLKGQDSHGFDYSHAVMLVSLLEHLILDEGLELLEAAYAVNGLSSEDVLVEDDLDKVFKSYLLIFAIGNRRRNKWNATQHHLDLANIKKMWPAWNDREQVVQDVHRNAAFVHTALQNPFAQRRVSFEATTKVMMAVTKKFSDIHDTECKALKNGLMDLDVASTGRVPLKKFWSQGRIGYWHLRESEEFLRQLGALDETALGGAAQVIISNYINAVSNCDAYSEYYSICCMQECDGILSELEAKIRKPSAPANLILGLVSNMSSPSVFGPRSLDAKLVETLEQVEVRHGGSVPLHGRLFFQWLHFAFPHECPYPHVSHAHNPLTPQEWQKQSGGRATISKDEYKSAMEDNTDEALGELMSMWTDEEEMRTGDPHSLGGVAAFSQSLVGVAQIAAALLILLGLVRTAATSVGVSAGPGQKRAIKGKTQYSV